MMIDKSANMLYNYNVSLAESELTQCGINSEPILPTVWAIILIGLY